MKISTLLLRQSTLPSPSAAKTAPSPPLLLFTTAVGSRGRIVIAMAGREFSTAAAAAAVKRGGGGEMMPTPIKPSSSLEVPTSTSSWTPLPLSAQELDLDFTLPTGQSFRWRKTSPSVYTGVIGNRLVQVSQRESHLREKRKKIASSSASSPGAAETAAAAFRVLKEADAFSSTSSASEQLADYFNAHISLAPMASSWALSDPRWRTAGSVVRGARVLRQPPLECLLSFICSSNNSIGRITGMVEHLARRYGTLLASAEEVEELLREEEEGEGEELAVKKEEEQNEEAPATPLKPSAALSSSGARPSPRAPFYSFPTLRQLSGSVTEADLRDAGFGYRAKYIVGTVEALAALSRERAGSKSKSKSSKKSKDEDEKLDDDDFLLSLREAPQEEALRELAKLPGVGPKVAACVALFSLDKHAVVPVDTHVWQLAARHYVPSIRNKPFSPAAGDLVSSALTRKFGPFAGWAHNTLFIAELPGTREKVAEFERLARRKKEKGGGGGGGESGSGSSSDDESGSESEEEEEEAAAKPPAKKRDTAAARAAEAAATFNKIKAEEGRAVPGTPGQ